jgi:hypothetical protein
VLLAHCCHQEAALLLLLQLQWQQLQLHLLQFVLQQDLCWRLCCYTLQAAGVLPTHD